MASSSQATGQALGEGESGSGGGAIGGKKMLIVFEGEGTLWHKSRICQAEEDGEAVT